MKSNVVTFCLVLGLHTTGVFAEDASINSLLDDIGPVENLTMYDVPGYEFLYDGSDSANSHSPLYSIQDQGGLVRDRDAMIRNARELIRSGNPHRALEVLKPLVGRERSAGWKTWFWSGTAHLLTGDFLQAANDLDTALSYKSDGFEIWVQRAIVEQELKNYKGSMRLLKTALKLAPAEPMIWLNIAALNDRMQKPDEAEQAYKRFLALSSNSEHYRRQRKNVVTRLIGLAR